MDGMKPIGVVKRVDRLGRILIPNDLRQTMGIKTDDPFEIFADESSILLKKYERTCFFCNGSDDIVQFKGKNICANCRNELAHCKD